MRRYMSLLGAGVLAVCACTQIDPESASSQLADGSSISVNLTMEDLQIEDETKAYLNQKGSTWNYVWEDGDQMAYFQFRNSIQYGHSRAEVDKRPSGCQVLYSADNFKAGDVIYSYLYQPQAEAEMSGMGISNTDPNALYMRIPTYQTTNTTPEEYTYSIDHSFSVINVDLFQGLPNVSLSGDQYDNPVGYVAPSGTIAFKIKNYDRNLTYACTGASNLSIDYYGNATVDIDFRAISNADFVSQSQGSGLIGGVAKTIKTYSQTYPISIYIEGYEDCPATFNVTAEITHTTGTLHAGIVTPTLAISYSSSPSAAAATVIESEHIFGETKPYPVRDCMPCVSKALKLTSAMLQYPEEIQGEMTIYMLGSVIEFRLYSLDNSVAVGEKLLGVIFTSDSNCAGNGVYNLTSGNLTLSGMSENTVISEDTDGKIVKYGKDNYVSLYVVVAPGTYTSEISFVTDKYVYTFHNINKTYSRATKKAITTNLASASCDVQTIYEFYDIPDPNASSEGGTDEDDDDIS